jgi:hypothetical protein
VTTRCDILAVITLIAELFLWLTLEFFAIWLGWRLMRSWWRKFR